MIMTVVKVTYVVNRCGHVGCNVLIQGATESDINQLTTTTNAKNWLPSLDKFVEQF